MPGDRRETGDGTAAGPYGEPDPEDLEAPFGSQYAEPDPQEVGAALASESDVDPELLRAFWGLVGALNIGLFAVSIGLLLVVFRGNLRLGGGLVLLGVVALVGVGVGYRRYRNG